MFFYVTEWLCTAVALHLLDARSHPADALELLVLLDLGLVHLYVAGVDQLVAHVMLGRGYTHQSARDLGLLTGDVAHVLIALLELSRLRTNSFRLYSAPSASAERERTSGPSARAVAGTSGRTARLGAGVGAGTIDSEDEHETVWHSPLALVSREQLLGSVLFVLFSCAFLTAR